MDSALNFDGLHALALATDDAMLDELQKSPASPNENNVTVNRGTTGLRALAGTVEPKRTGARVAKRKTYYRSRERASDRDCACYQCCLQEGGLPARACASCRRLPPLGRRAAAEGGTGAVLLLR
jgi:hypothetical protein